MGGLWVVVPSVACSCIRAVGGRAKPEGRTIAGAAAEVSCPRTMQYSWTQAPCAGGAAGAPGSAERGAREAVISTVLPKGSLMSERQHAATTRR